MALPTYTSDQMDALARVLAEAALNELINEISTREILEERAEEMKKASEHDFGRPQINLSNTTGDQQHGDVTPREACLATEDS
jgi:hypothetical protein